MELTILIPALNEEKTLGIVIDKAKKWIKKNCIDAEILVVNNGSTDRTKEIALELGARVIDFAPKGYGLALRKGIENAKGKYIIMGDADDSYNFLELNEMFGVEKPIIALLHLDALPGDPGYCGSMEQVIEHARDDLISLQDGGVDGILFANEFSLPYQPVADIAVISAMAYIIGNLKPLLRLPFGVNVVKNPIATIDLAAATGARFARSCFSGAYMGEYGLYTSNSGEAVRRRKALGIPDLKLLYKVNPEADTYLVQRDIQVVSRSILFGGFADGLCVSGAAAGSEPDDVLLEKVWQVARPRGVPVFCNTGCRHENVRDKLQRCDAVCMGTAFKKDGVFNERVDRSRVECFMDIVRDIRAGL